MGLCEQLRNDIKNKPINLNSKQNELARNRAELVDVEEHLAGTGKYEHLA